MARLAWRCILGFAVAMMAWVGGFEIAAQPVPAAAGAPAATSAASTAYKLGVDDKITLAVFGEQELSKEYQVGPDGYVEVPLIGHVQAQGRTITEFSEEVRARLADGFIRNPSVAGTITTFRPFFILGEVNKPGEYPYREGLTVVSAVATAEGYTYRAQKRFVYSRAAGAADEVRTELTPGLLVQPGQTIRVPQRYF